MEMNLDELVSQWQVNCYIIAINCAWMAYGLWWCYGPRPAMLEAI
jgi:hypothetical protein